MTVLTTIDAVGWLGKYLDGDDADLDLPRAPAPCWRLVVDAHDRRCRGLVFEETRAEVLADPQRSKRLLDEAVRAPPPSASQISFTTGHILDQSGITAERLGDLDGAKAAYSEACDLRTATGHELARA
jgi:hypothetical protein